MLRKTLFALTALAANFLPLLYTTTLAARTCCAQSSSPKLLAQSDWPSWRGPSGNGWAPADSRPPVKFGSGADTSVLKWKAPIPGRGHSSPIVVGSRIFLSSADEARSLQFVLCLDLQTGKQLWQQTLSEGGFPSDNHAKNTEASPTIASNGQTLFVTFFHHQKIELVALDLDGHVQWREDVCAFNPRQFEYGYAPSPVLYQNLVIVAAEYDGPSFLVALEQADGREVWRTPRPASISFSTPMVIHVAGRDQLVISGQNQVMAYDPSNGQQMWQVEGTTMATCGTAISSGNLVIASGGYPKAETLAIKADGSAQVVWRNNQKCYEQSMIVVDGFVYALTDKGIMYCWDAADGTEKWRERLAGPVSASPIYAGGHIYWSNEAGSMYVLKPNPERFELVAENRVGNSAFASPAVTGNQILLRVGEKQAGQLREFVYCFGS